MRPDLTSDLTSSSSTTANMEEAVAVTMDYINSEWLRCKLKPYAHIIQHLTIFLLRCNISWWKSSTKRLNHKARALTQFSILRFDL